MNLYKDNITFEDYKQLVEKYDVQDNREINYQNEIVKPMLQIIFQDWNIVDVSIKVGGRPPKEEAKKHDYSKYCGTYKAKNSKGEIIDKYATPDLLIAENWNWYNRDNESIKYHAIVEVKSPFSDDHLCNREYNKYSADLITALTRHLQANDIVIATDTYKWGIYTLENEKVVSIKEYPIREYKSGKWIWDEEKYNDLVSDLINLRDTNMDLSVIKEV